MFYIQLLVPSNLNCNDQLNWLFVYFFLAYSITLSVYYTFYCSSDQLLVPHVDVCPGNIWGNVEALFRTVCLCIDDSNDEGDTDEKELSGADVWTKSAKDIVERSKEDEFDDYFKDMLL